MSRGINIHAVGHHLQVKAMSAGPDDRDAFARSAFNRYYYSAFLNTRALLGSLDPAWSSHRHANYPKLLKGRIRRELNSRREKARKNEDDILVNRIDRAKREINELAKIMTEAYAVRVVADYELEEPVSFDEGPRFSLRSVDISDAHQWENATRILCGSVGKLWNEIHD